MFVLPISMARSMDWTSSFQRNHVSGINTVQHSMIIFKNQRPVFFDAARPADENLIQMLNFYALSAPTEMRFPKPPQSVKAGFFKLSIAPVEGLNQSHQNGFAIDIVSRQIGDGSRPGTNLRRHRIDAIIDIDADAEDHMFDHVRRASSFGQNPRQLLAVD